MDYQAIRQENNAALDKYRKERERAYRRTASRLTKQVELFNASLEAILANEGKIMMCVHGIEYSLRMGKIKQDEIYVITRPLWGLGWVGAPVIGRQLKEVVDMMTQEKISTIDSFLGEFYESLNGLQLKIKEAAAEKILDSEKAQVALSKIEECKKGTEMTSYQEAGRVVSFLKGNSVVRELYDALMETTKGYEERIKTQVFRAPKHLLTHIARKNVEALLATANEQELRRMAMKESGEAELLLYATYELEAWNAGKDEAVNDERDLRYYFFLDEKADEQVREMVRKGKSLADIQKGIEELGETWLTEDEKAIILKKVQERMKEETKEPEKDDWRERMVLLEGYGIPQRESARLAKLMNTMDFRRVYDNLTSTIEPALARLIIRTNPELLLLNDRQVAQYCSTFHHLITSTSHLQLSDFDPYQSPKNFSSIGALHVTKRKLEKVITEATKESWSVSELDTVLAAVGAEGIDAEMAALILKGFWFAGSLFQGSHKLGEDKLEKNVARSVALSNPETRKAFDRTKKQLLTTGVIVNKGGGLSLNTHLNDIESQGLRKLLEYVRKHHPTEYT